VRFYSCTFASFNQKQWFLGLFGKDFFALTKMPPKAPFSVKTHEAGFDISG